MLEQAAIRAELSPGLPPPLFPLEDVCADVSSVAGTIIRGARWVHDNPMGAFINASVLFFTGHLVLTFIEGMRQGVH